MNPEITVYTSTTCSFCQKQKSWLAKHSISFVEKPVEKEENSRELLERKILSVPYTIIKFKDSEKEYTVAGFNTDQLEKMLLGER